MIKFIKDIDNNILDIPELERLRLNQRSFRMSKEKKLLKKKYFKSTITFFDWYIDYCTKILNNKTYNNKQICERIFRSTIKTKNQCKEYLLKSIYISKDYVEYLKNNLTETNIHKYSDTIIGLEIDLEWLIANFEIHYKKSVTEISLTSDRRKNLNPTDIYFAAKALFFIEDFDNIEDLHLRDLKPAVMFYIRQLLEVFGRNLVGYNSIEDKDGNLVKKYTQIAWSFIKEEVKQTDPRIKFPFDVHMILTINNWANSFVHSTYIYSSYIQYFAIKTISVLFASDGKPIKIYNGNNQRKTCADIKIYNYNSLKLSFEKELESRQSGIKVNWMDTDNVGAYIISL